MKAKKPLNLKVIIPVLVAVLLIGAGATYMLIPREATAERASAATFEFNAAEAPGWFAGANIYPDAAISEPQATVSRIVAQGTAEKPEGNCFVQYSYWADSSKDLDALLDEATAPSDTTTSGAFSLEPVNVSTQTMKVSGIDTSFELHQYNLVGETGQQMSRGEEFAFLKAGTGYIEIRGYCKTAEELSITLPVLSAVSFVEK